MKDACESIASLSRIPGRLEKIHLPTSINQQNEPAVFVDFAHTPEALVNVLETLSQIKTKRLISVIGCGGDRDKEKRPLMGEAAAKLSDVTIITSDNPRSEDPAEIVAQIEKGVQKIYNKADSTQNLFDPSRPARGYMVVVDRHLAIDLACRLAAPEDIVLIAGKGHEQYQISKNGKQYFSDRDEAINGLMAWNNFHLLNATGGILLKDVQNNILTNISTDTRSLKEGEIFIALSGDNFDGHNYIESAVKKGAKAIIVDQKISPPENILIIQVDNCLEALGNLARYRRQLLQNALSVVAITGSSGKTTVKEITSAIFKLHLRKAFKTPDPLLMTKGNFNNLIGLPLSLLPVKANHKVAILEMGMNQPGEIRRLTEIAEPNIGCITNVQPAHLEGLGNIKNVAKAKGELFDTLPPKAIRIVNLDDKHVRHLTDFEHYSCIGFAVTAAGRRYRPLIKADCIKSLGEKGMRFTLHIGSWKKRLTIQATGMHNVSNSTAAAAIAYAAGIDTELIIQALSTYRSFDKRMEFDDLANGIKIVNDTYNANPSSMSAALETVVGFGKKCKHAAALGDMLELGDKSIAAHKKIGRLVGCLQYDYLATTGSFAAELAREAIKNGMSDKTARVFDSKEDMAQWFAELMQEEKLQKDDWLLVKGSRGMRMEKLLHNLKKYIQVTG